MTSSPDRFFDSLLEDAVQGREAPDLVARTLLRARGEKASVQPDHALPVKGGKTSTFRWRAIMQAAAIVLVCGLAAWIATAPGPKPENRGLDTLPVNAPGDQPAVVVDFSEPRDGYVKVVGRKQLDVLPEDSKAISVFEMTDDDLAALSRFKNLEQLEITQDSKGPVFSRKGAEYLGKLSTLKVIWLRNLSGLEDNWLDVLGAPKGLREVGIVGLTRLTDKGYASFAKFQNLTDLSLISCGLTDVGLREAARVTWMRRLDISGNEKLTDEGIQTIAKVTYLGLLDLSGCTSITGVGVARLREKLPRCEFVGVEKKVAPGTVLKPRFVQNRSEIEALPLDIDAVRGPDMGDDDLPALGRLKGLLELDLGAETNFRGESKSRITDAGLAAVGELAGLRTLILTNCHKITVAGFAHVGKLTGLRKLDLSGIDLSDDHLAHIARLTALEELYMGHRLPVSGPSRAGYDQLASLKNLRVFSATAPKRSLADDMVFLDGLEKIESLSFSGFYYDGQLKRALAHPNLRSLNIPIETDAAAIQIGKLKKLERLATRFNPDVSNEAMRHLAALPELVDLDVKISWGIGDKGMEYLGANRKLQRLRINGFDMRDGAQITDAGLEFLRGMTGLRELTLVAFYQVTKPAQEALRAALPECRINMDQ